MSEPPQTAIRDLIAARTNREVRRAAITAVDRVIDADFSTLATDDSEPTGTDGRATDRPTAVPDATAASIDPRDAGRDRGAATDGRTVPDGPAEPHLIDDLEASGRPEPRHLGPDGRRYRSLLRVPVGDGRALVALASEPAAFDETDLEAVAELGTYVEAALERVAADATRRDARERITEVADVLSHDVHNSLTIAEGHLQLARDGRDDDHLERVDVAHDRIAELLDDAIAFARTGDRVDAIEPVELSGAVERAWANVEAGSATVRVVDDPTVRADESSLRQLLENLFRNAVEHGSARPASQARQAAGERGSTSSRSDTPGDGVDDGATSSRSPAPEDASEDGDPEVSVRVGALEDGIYVEDDGPGIPRAHRDRVFVSGHTTTEDGTGFGLSIVRRIADVHGWDVRVGESGSGGARFEITGVEMDPVVAAA